MTIDVGHYGVWTFGKVTPEQAVAIERLGYGAVWIGGSPPGDLPFAEAILDSTESLQLATGIINVWTAPAEQTAETFHRLEKAYPGRFLLGIGIGHPEHTQEYRKPYDVLVEYLDELDAAGVPAQRRVVAALGPKVLRLARDRSAGAHPYLTTPEHTAEARKILGDGVFLAPEHKVVLTDGSAEATAEARRIGRDTVDFYLNLSNYLNSWRRLGFTEEDIAKPGSDKLIDAVVAHGTAEAIAGRLAEHIDAGADQVTIQVLGGWDKLLPTLTALAGPLGLKGHTG
ncbi:LLM class F420-dependent oxidoreductase [Mycolicibacterium sp. J2]|uniref:LLM class F420-dependent oxidoreductase n=1 Tax=Mycolicibacterium sp. J2 TaxID=2993511 RepID=UPI00224AB085|nr:LLM class F420-dependent oxidoreductase [Mycolicibacterium sp. J2]MCX2712086.1 LLM class F420-dependent oxidoreductase [Mycolicibacterium sp. J2]